MSDGLGVPALATAAGLAAAAAGVWLTGAHRHSRIVVPFSAGILLGVVCFGLLPELSEDIGWLPGLSLFLGGYVLLFLVNRYVSPVCPTCSHDHDHNACTSELHGFAAPLLSAAALHCFLDGWSISASQHAVHLGLRVAVPLAVVLHKVPEGMALGGIVRVSMPSRVSALTWCALAQAATLVGGLAGVMMAPQLGAAWITYPLGVATGWLFYLGYHAVHEEWKRRGFPAAFLSAGGGMATAALLQHGLEAMMH